MAAYADGEQLIIPSGVTSIEAEAFADCESITAVTIPASVTTIGSGCFSGCTNLKSVYFGGTAEQWKNISIGTDNAPMDNVRHIFLGGYPASETMTFNGKSYTASYFGQEDISRWHEKYASRKFWRLENAYDDFREIHCIDDNLPEDNYPMPIEAEQVFVIDYTLKSGGVYREVMRCDGNIWQGMLTTHALAVVDIPPVRTDILTVNGKQYTASYFGSSPYTRDGHTNREFWRLENAYNDFKNVRFYGSHVPDNNYPMGIEAGQVYVIDYHMDNGRSYRNVLRCDGIIRDDGRLDSQAIAADSPIYTEALTINEKNYTANYFGAQKLPDSDEKYASRVFWRLENAYDDFRSTRHYGGYLPENNYPMGIQAGQIYVVEYTLRSGGTERMIMRCDGETTNDGRINTTRLAVDIPPIRTDILTVNGKNYTASYFGSQTLPDSDERYSSREFWRLENAYQDFKDCAFANDNLPESNYPMDIHPRQVFVIDYTLRSGGVFRELMRCDGNTWNGMLTTHAFTVN